MPNTSVRTMLKRHNYHKPDLLMVLVLLVGMGVVGSVAYQLTSELGVPETANISTPSVVPTGG